MATLDNSGRPFWIIFTGFFQMILGGLFDENTQMVRNVKTVDRQGNQRACEKSVPRRLLQQSWLGAYVRKAQVFAIRK
jgi:hypothetical protein